MLDSLITAHRAQLGTSTSTPNGVAGAQSIALLREDLRGLAEQCSALRGNVELRP